ncbi:MULTISPECIES: sensor histidine kinase [Sphingomonas]|uniref:histidine kinase n=1 Tax=Sphingomonas kyungheensis TaxID=1069987 RepID=A0ABU8H652_9SPHN|nr:histidine kinase dimerization/phosphoacceptor domain -containing protein [Sphingomonas sp. CV7422]
MYIDDDDGLRRLAARGLERRGYRVTTAAGGAEGVRLAAAAPFDLIAVDHYMPDMDGLDTLAQLAELPAMPPVVYVTGSDEGRIAIAALKAGAADYVVKSIGDDFFDLLANSFGQVLDRSRLAREKARVEEDLRASNARLEALLGEVNHRVANSLQLVSAMVRLQASALADPAARTALDDTQRRIAAIAQVHRCLYSANDVESVDMRDYLGSLIRELNDTLSCDTAPHTLHLDAEPIRLPTDRAVSLGVIVTELVTNACKYAYPTGDGGEIRVTMLREAEGFRLSVEDDGCGMAEGAAPKGTGLGTRLLQAMAQSLHTTILYEPRERGVCATVRAAI